MYANINRSPESLLELFQNAAKARSGSSLVDTPKKEVLKNIIITGPSLAQTNSDSPVISSESPLNDTSALRQFLMHTSNGSMTSCETFSKNSKDVLVQFKKSSLDSKSISGKIMASSGPFLAYILNEKKIRIINTLTGQKCSVDRVQGSFVSLAWSDDYGQEEASILAILAEDGEVTLGRISSKEARDKKIELLFDVISILSFPEIGRARGMSWSSGDSLLKKHLAIFGHSSSEVFFVHFPSNGLNNNIKSSFLSSKVSDIRNVSVFDDGSCWIIGQSGDMEKFHFIGSSFQSELNLTISCSSISDALVFESTFKFYLFVLENKYLKLFSIFKDKLTEISSLSIDSMTSEICFHSPSRLLLLFGRGSRNAEIISFQNFNSPKFVDLPSLELESTNSSVILDAIFCDNVDEKIEDKDTAQINILFYYSDSICNHELYYNLSKEVLEIETDDMIQDFESDTDKSILSKDNEDKQLKSLAPASISSDQFNISFHKAEIKEIIRETIRETLVEVIQDAIDQGIQAGLSQLNNDISSLIRNLIQSTESNISVSDSNESPPLSNIQGIRNLLSEGKIGLALKKSIEIDNARLLLEICQNVSDPFSILDEEQFSQLILSQMFRLLSLDIEEDTEVKLDWLQEILIQIDLDTAMVESPKILEQVDTLFSQLKSLLNDSLADGILQKKMKTVMRLLRKFQMN